MTDIAHGSLPPVDAAALLMETRPEVLAGYSEALLKQLRVLQTGASSPYPFYKMPLVRAAVIWLVRMYHNVGIPLTADAALLVIALVPKRAVPEITKRVTGEIDHASVMMIRELILSTGIPGPKPSTFNDVQESNLPAYWAAVDFEAKHPEDPTDRYPSVKSRYAVAQYVLSTVGLPGQGTRKRKALIEEPQKSAEWTVKA